MTTPEHRCCGHATAADAPDATAVDEPADAPGAPATARPDAAPAQGTHGYSHDREAYRRRLKRVEGQVRGIQRMIDQDVYCIDVVTQISAATSALQNLSVALMEDHLHHCVVDAIDRGDGSGDQKITEAMKAIKRMVKS